MTVCFYISELRYHSHHKRIFFRLQQYYPHLPELKIQEERFLILPHDEVVTYMTTRATQHERWLRGMRRLQSRVFKTATGQ